VFLNTKIVINATQSLPHARGGVSKASFAGFTAVVSFPHSLPNRWERI
jgi:hypothetical protein